jgi:CBS-domain-containing membrane protein
MTTKTVAHAMVRNPKTFGLDTRVRDALAAFENAHVHMLLLVDGPTLRGTVERSDLTPGLPHMGPALELAALIGRTVPPDAPLAVVHEQMVIRGQRRLAVVDPEGTLLGLLCLKRSRAWFCTDEGIQARAWERRQGLVGAGLPTHMNQLTSIREDVTPWPQ